MPNTDDKIHTKMAESVDLATIRREAFLRALHRAAQDPSVTIVTVALLGQALALPLGLLRFVIDPLVSEGLIRIEGGLDSGSVLFTEKGIFEANKVVNRRSPLRAAIKILCVDTEPETVQRLKDAGYAIFEVSMGYRTGKRNFPFPPPNEMNFIACDLRRPACFDSRDWGPSGNNDNFRCRVVPHAEVNNTFYVTDGYRHARYKVVSETQLGKPIPGTFGPKEMNRAIVEGGVPFFLFLNEEWLNHVVESPNWLDVKWAFLPTAATEVEMAEPLPTLLPELGREIKFKLAIQHQIKKGPLFGRTPPQFPTSDATIVTNNIGDVFGQFVKMGKGGVWLLPATHQNADILELLASRLETMRQLVHSQELLSTAGDGFTGALKLNSEVGPAITGTSLSKQASYSEKAEVPENQQDPLTDIEHQITKSVVSTFLLSRESTPKVSLLQRFEEPMALRHLASLRILTAWDDPPNLLPTVLAFHYCGDMVMLDSGKTAVHVVVRALLTLFRTDWNHSRTHKPEELLSVLNSANSVPVPSQISLGLFLVRDFGDNVLGGWTTNDLHTQVATFQISENIVAVKDTARLWDDHVRNNSGQIEDSVKPFRFEERFGEGMTSTKSDSRKVFLVHGHDGEAKHAVARFLEQLDLQPIILHEQENRGRTIIEKFEANSDVAFAVVLLTPDDVGQSALTKAEPKPRARQNVILELGFFFGKLGRANVCALYKGEVELPSDVDGVIYIPYDDHDGWKTKLAKELKAAGITVDLNKV
jgi:predicted nucleotide-binding protein